MLICYYNKYSHHIPIAGSRKEYQNLTDLFFVKKKKIATSYNLYMPEGFANKFEQFSLYFVKIICCPI